MQADKQPFSLVTNQASVATRISSATLAGLLISLFAMVVIRHAFAFFVSEITFASAILKETLIWASAAALLVIIRRGERLSFRSIGLGTCRWWKSIAWGLVIAIVSAVVVGSLAYLTGYGHGPGSAAFEKLPLSLITLIVFRAGVVEELFYRGYAIERLRMIGLGSFRSVTIPLVVFSLGHWSGGAANILIALAAGISLRGFHFSRRSVVVLSVGVVLVGLFGIVVLG